MSKLLLVDDEKRMLDLLKLYLAPHGYDCEKASSGIEAIQKIETSVFDAVLLDVMMPDKDGWETCRDIRRISDVPIIMLTARDEKNDMVKGLELGADDYVTKPFDEEILIARLKAVLRRSGASEKIEANGLIYNGATYEMKYENQDIFLTKKEFELMGILLKNPGKVYNRHHLIDAVWGWDSETEGRTVDSHIRNIRTKCKKAGFPIDDHLQTVWGVGYKWIN